MSTFTQKKCPTCGGRLELLSGNQYECRCCHNVYELNERNANLYHDLQVASTFRESLNFKQAELMYKNLLKEYKDDNLADVYWNLLLCEQRVMFESNEKGEQFPSFYDIVPMEIEESENYNKTIEYLNKFSPQNIGTYVELVDKMYTAKRKCRTIKNTSKPYDIFICFKKSKLDGEGVTEEYKLAFDLYNILSKDYNVFFSERSLNNIVVREYEPNIYHALYTAKIMLVLCSKREYLESQWVKNEWSRFKMFSTTTSQTKAIIPIFVDGFQENCLPDEIRTCQGIRADYSLTESLKSAVKAILNPTDKQAEMAAKLKAEMQEQMKEQMLAFTKQFGGQSTPMPTQSASVPTQSAPAPIHTPTSDVKYIVPYGATSILENQFKGREDIVEAIIPDTVRNIGKEAFRDCTKLMKVVIPESVTNIEDSAFFKCTSLQVIELGKGVQKIGEYAFRSCKSLTNIALPEGLKTIAKSAFAFSGLTSIVIPQSVDNIGFGIVGGCSNLTSIKVAQGNGKYYIVDNCLIDRDSYTLLAGCKSSVIPSDGSVITIGELAFSYIYGSTELEIPEGVTTIGTRAFNWIENLTKVVIPDSVTDICEEAFSCCKKLQSVTMGKNVASIGFGAFGQCESLTEILLPNSIKNIDKLAFYRCLNLNNISYDGAKIDWECVKKSDDWNQKVGNGNVKCLRLVTEGTKEIPDRAFHHQFKLSNKFLGDLPSSDIVIPDSVTRIGKEAFYDCEELESITIGSGVEFVDELAFYGCNSLKQVHIKDLAKWCDIEFVKHNSNPLGYAHNLYINGKLVTDLVVPNGVKSIRWRAFAGCTSILSATLPSSVTNTEYAAFAACSNMRSVTMSNGIKVIGESCFGGCNELTDIVIPNSVTTIGCGAFSNCVNLKSIVIPDSVTQLGFDAFKGCMRLEDVKLSNQLKTIEFWMFGNCHNLKKVTIPIAVTKIESDAFNGCSALEHIYYGGTMKQWKAIDKDKSLMHSWNKNTGKYIVHCTDGDLKK